MTRKQFRGVKIGGSIIVIFICSILLGITSLAGDSRERCQSQAYGIYYCEDEATLEEVQNVALMYNQIPVAVRDFLAWKQVKVYVCANPNADNEKSVCGKAYWPSLRSINGGPWCVTRPGFIEIYSGRKYPSYTTVIHEVGHELDEYAGVQSNQANYGLSTKEKWVNYYNQYKEQILKIDVSSKYNTYSEIECWAEAVRLLYSKPEKLIAISPELYQYVVDEITNLVGGDATPTQMLAPETKAGFDHVAYADAYPDLKAAFGYDKDLLWNHYLEYGKLEGRVVHFKPVTESTTGTYNNFDYKLYADTYPDLKAAFGYNKKKLWNHYNKYGKNEGRIVYFQ